MAAGDGAPGPGNLLLGGCEDTLCSAGGSACSGMGGGDLDLPYGGCLVTMEAQAPSPSDILDLIYVTAEPFVGLE